MANTLSDEYNVKVLITVSIELNGDHKKTTLDILFRFCVYTKKPVQLPYKRMNSHLLLLFKRSESSRYVNITEVYQADF